ncbi:hypothetical protein [Kribbella pratensis]|uniref:hypothetical protein n=1 Tax=Kribbella pratensis TaxID=2512112 RepID=UPI00192D9FD7|nr:hypothetical protein [Kribbella pratensis]
MSEQELKARFEAFPAAVREKVNNVLMDAKVALKVKVGEALSDKDEQALHAVTTAGGSAR